MSLTLNERDPATLRRGIQALERNVSRAPFESSTQTGTGAEQEIAHGLGATPRLVFVEPVNLTGGAYVVTNGTHDATYVRVTVTSGEQYRVIALPAWTV